MYRVNNGVPNQLTHGSTVHAERACRHLRLLRAGAMDARTADAAGRTSLRQGAWLVPAAAGRSNQIHAESSVLPGNTRGRQLQGHHSRLGPRTTSSATVERRRSSRWVSTWKARAPATRSPFTTPTQRCGCRTPILHSARKACNAPGRMQTRNFQPDCDLQNPLAQDLRPGGGDFCGQISNLAFGTSTLTNSFADDVLNGWGVRSNDWGLSASVQQQLMERASIEIAYHRRWFSGFTLNDNRFTTSSNYTRYGITAPSDPRLPDGGGYRIENLFDIDPSLFGRIDNLTALARNYGEWYRYFNGLDITSECSHSGRVDLPGRYQHRAERGRCCDVRASLPS